MSTFLQSKTAGAKPRRKMDGGLLCVSETELTSVRLIERAHARALADKLTLAEMMRIWRCIGRVIGASLMLGKGVNVDGLGVFCFDLDGAPMFALQPVGGINWRPQTRQLPGQCTVLPKASLKLVMELSTQSREMVDTVLREVITEAQRAAKHICPSFFLSFASVGEFVWTADDPSGPGLRGYGPAGVRFNNKLKSRLRHAMRKGTTKKSIKALLAERYVRPLQPAPGYEDGDAGAGAYLGDEDDDDASFVSASSSRSSRSTSSGRGAGRGAGAQGGAPKPATTAEACAAALAHLKRQVCDEKRGGRIGVRSLFRNLLNMDDSGDGELDAKEFQSGLRDMGIVLSAGEINAIMSFFDRDGGGTLTVQELRGGVRGTMPGRRAQLVRNVYNTLPGAARGKVSISTVKRRFDPYCDPRLRSGKLREEAVLGELVAQIESSERDGFVTCEEFMDYYSDVSAAMDDDKEFDAYVREGWQYTGMQGWNNANSANQRAALGSGVPDLEVRETDEFARAITLRGADGASDASSERSSRASERSARRGAPGGKAREAWQGRARNFAPFDTHDDFDDAESLSEYSDAGSHASARPSARPGLAVRHKHDAARAAHSHSEDPWATLWRALYRPACSCEALMRKLGVSCVPPNRARLPATALAVCLRKNDAKLPTARALEVAQAVARELADDAVAARASAIAGDRAAAPPRGARSRLVVDVEDLHARLSRLYGHDTEGAKPSSVLARIKKLIWQKTGNQGVRGLEATFRKYAGADENAPPGTTLTLDANELRQALAGCGVRLTLLELEQLVQAFDRDGSGEISLDEFLEGLGGRLNAERSAVVERVYASIARHARVAPGAGVPLSALEECHDMSWQGAGDAAELDDARGLVMKTFNDDDGIVTKDEFLRYCEGLSATIDGDRYFAEVMEMTWHPP